MEHDRELNSLDTATRCLLSLDGGGVRGLSTLYILKGLMYRLNGERQAAGLPPKKPCEIFDLIGGTSTGGLIAIMLGRLEMDVDECIAAYVKLMRTVFEKQKSRFPIDLKVRVKARFDSKKLKAAIEEVIRSKAKNPTDPFNDGTGRACRTFVCSAAKEYPSIVRLRSYALIEEDTLPVTICEAALATSAATTFFDPVSIGARHFVDGALGANNPVYEVESEAANIWSSGTGNVKPLVKCFISIGTGVPSKKALEDSVLKFLAVNLKELSTQTEETERKFIGNWAQQYNEHRYFRFNVSSGLDKVGLAEYKKQGLMEVATESYLNHQAQKSQVGNCVRKLQQKETEVGSLACLSQDIEQQLALQSQKTIGKPCWNVPFKRNHDFVERGSYLNDLEETLFAENHSRRVAVTGLGGVGKTQIVLELAYRVKKKYSKCNIFWIPATNNESLQQALFDVGKQLRIPGIEEKEADVKKLLQQHLSQETASQWLLIIDNADDPDIWRQQLKYFLPKTTNGSIVCTTRTQEVAVDIAASNVKPVSEMEETNAVQLLSKFLIKKELMNNRQEARNLLKQLTFLPLAIVQAASYINKTHITLSEYSSLLNKQESEVIALLSRDFEDEGRYKDVKNPVAITWLISFEHIRDKNPLAAEYLSFMACISPKDIPRSILPPAPSQIDETEAIGVLQGYSFVTRRVEDQALEVHRLVHLATRNWLNRQEQLILCTNEALAHFVKVMPWGTHDQRATWRTYLPHARHILDSSSEDKGKIGNRTKLLEQYAHCLKADGRYSEAAHAFSSVLKVHRQVAGENDTKTLRIERKVADVYRDQGRSKEAEISYLRILKIQTKTLGEEDSSLLITKAHLALTYKDLGRWREAKTLELEVMEIRSRTLGSDLPETIVSTSSLAQTYRLLGQWKQAEELQVHVLEKYRRVLGEEHPDTLLSMNNLALTYSNQGQWKQAEELQVQVLEKYRRVLGEEHPDTLNIMNNLALTYSDQGQWEQAEELQVQVLEKYRGLLGEEHPNTLLSINNLALTYSKQSQWKQAEELQVQVLEKRRRLLGEEHPHTLTSMNNLAWTYYREGNGGKAIALMGECCHLKKKVIGPQHPDTINSLKSLDRFRLAAEGASK